MPLTSSIIQPIADHACTILKALGLGVNVWADDELTMGANGAAEIEIPDLGRTGVEERESQLGFYDWDLEFPVTIWVNLTQGPKAQQRLVAVTEAWIAAVDADPTLGGLVLEAKVTGAKRQYQLAKRPLVGFETTLAALRLVPVA
jgi:hypothetical protein